MGMCAGMRKGGPGAAPGFKAGYQCSPERCGGLPPGPDQP